MSKGAMNVVNLHYILIVMLFCAVFVGALNLQNNVGRRY